MLPNKRSKNLKGLAAIIVASAVTPFAVAQIAAPDVVESAPIATDAFAIGGISPAEGALPSSLWDRSDPQTLEYLLGHLPARPVSPSIGQAMRRTLLSSGTKPSGASPSLGGRKLLALTRAGFVTEARDIASLATSGRSDLTVAEADATINLLTNNLEAACRRGASLNGGREALFWVRLRAFCYARAGELDAFDLTMNLLRERGALKGDDETLLLAVAGAEPKTMPTVSTAIQYAAAKSAGLSLDAGAVANAQGGVLAAIADDTEADKSLRIAALEQLVAMGVADITQLKGLFNEMSFEVAELGAVMDIAQERPADAGIDAMLYQSIGAMNAPEFIRDKAQRISFALSRADGFHRAYSLAHLYADEIASLEGVLVTPEEASRFAVARMAVGDSVGAGRWLTAMIGTNESVAALPEPLGLAFIDRVNLLSNLDPQTAARIARAAGVSLLTDEPAHAAGVSSHEDPSVTARILTAAFDAVAGEKQGQASLAALAASAGKGPENGEVEMVVIGEGLNAAGMPELRRLHEFERAWAATFVSGASTEDATSHDGDGFVPRIKPRVN
ncbi:hypothetical protein ABFZ85_05490 [Hyphococcus formosus]|uniref:hypothetical protein n=1 Tax=Hyphococcus formosus TaxID=3143534 RepID=UPI00398A55D4